MVLTCFKFSCKLPPVSLRCSRTCHLFLTDVYNCQRRRLPPVVMPKFELKNIGSRVRRGHCSTTELHSVLVTVIIDFFCITFSTDGFIHWPILFFEVLSIDTWERYRTEGYGYVTIPNKPGTEDCVSRKARKIRGKSWVERKKEHIVKVRDFEKAIRIV